MRVKGVCTVRVIEADTESPRPFMVTEYAEGPSLAEYIDSHGLLGPDMLYGLATGLAEALTVIHAAGIVHRDLKPSNVILTDAGPKVIDFGIAQALDAMSMTKTGMMVGSAGFMAPEQISGRPGPAADIFVWGVTVAYAATGQSPFGTGETHAVLYRVIHAEPDITAVPDPLRPLVAAALAKDPDRRPTAQQLLDRLTSISHAVAARVHDSPTQTILSKTWQQTGPHPGQPGPAARPADAKGSCCSIPHRRAPGRAGRPDRRRPGRAGSAGAPRRWRQSALAAAAVAVAVVIAMLPGHAPKAGPSANEGGPGQRPGRGEHPADLPGPADARRLPDDPAHRRLGEHDGDDGLAENRRRRPPAVLRLRRRRAHLAAGPGSAARRRSAPAGLSGRRGSPAARTAGWRRAPNAIWTSPDGRSWTLAATHGITPQQPGDTVNVVTSTPGGFLAGGYEATSAGQQAVIWTSHDGVTWQRLTAAQLGLTGVRRDPAEH